MSLSFPYPSLGNVKRPAGQGCKTCVHKYCPALYWNRRYGAMDQNSSEWSGPDDNMGTQCASWSNNIADQVRTVSNGDREEEEYVWVQGTGSEADRNGIVTPTSGTSRRP